tara:strand:+ start:670 stop:813 length:144 start_codon:yes stop_codon:yes gene_type:complete
MFLTIIIPLASLASEGKKETKDNRLGTIDNITLALLGKPVNAFFIMI